MYLYYSAVSDSPELFPYLHKGPRHRDETTHALTKRLTLIYSGGN
jgi:hypothetical protein